MPTRASESHKNNQTIFYIFPFCTKDDCRVIDFDELIERQALTGHVITTVSAPDRSYCQLRCYLDNDCVSFNFGLGATGAYNVCELNNSTDKRYLETREKFVYMGSEVNQQKLDV